MAKLKVISLYQPYATLMAIGHKTNETRSWPTRYRGPLLIHATAKMPDWCRDLLHQPFFQTSLQGIQLPLGKIVGRVEVIGCIKTQDYLEYVKQLDVKSQGKSFDRFQREIAYGDYSADRYAWQTQGAERFEQPIPAKGSQGFWEFDLPTDYGH